MERCNSPWWSQITALVLAIVCVLLNTPFAQAKGCGDITDLAEQLDVDLPRWMAQYDVAGISLLLMSEGKIAFVRAYGLADVQTQRALSVNDIFRVESISKPVTAWGVLRLDQIGNLDLDEHLRTYLPDLAIADTTTTRMVLNHTAGLPLGDFTARFDPDGVVPTLRESLLSDLPQGTSTVGQYIYSDTGYNLLEFLIEYMTGEPFADYMAEEILGPLGMTHSTYLWRSDMRARMPMAYDLHGDTIQPYVYPGHGSGGLFATIDDIGNFMQASVKPSNTAQGVLSPASIKQMHQMSVSDLGLFGLVADGYGLGHFVETASNGQSVIWHGGQGAGWMTDFHIIPDTGDGILILSNSQRSWPVFARILADWSIACGFRPVGMARIRIVELSIWGISHSALLIAIWGLFVAVHGIKTGQRHLRPLSSNTRTWRAVQATLAVIILVGLTWASSQDYLFIWSVAPTAMPWLATSLVALALSLAFLATASPD